MPILLRLSVAALLLSLGSPAWTTAAQEARAPGPDAAPEADSAQEDGGLFADPQPGEAEGQGDTPPPSVEGEDLPIGRTLEIDANQASFRYHAQEPGMLTLLAYAPGDRTRVEIQIKNAQGRLIPGGMVNGNANRNNPGPRIVVDPFGNPQGSLPGLAYLTVPIDQAGDYLIEMSVTGEAQAPTKIGGSWVGFEQLATPGRAVPGRPGPAPPVAPPAPFDPTEVAQELAVNTAHQVEIDGELGAGWIKLTAPDAGTLVVVTHARRGDVQLAAFADGAFDNPREYVDRDRQGDLGREALMLHADAGEVWYIRIDARGNTHVPVRTAFILDDLEPADDDGQAPVEGE